MKKFKYRAMKSDGTKIEGKFEGSSRDDVINMITSSGYYPLIIEEQIEFKFFERVTTKDLAIFCRQFYTMLDAGVTITTCLNILSNEIPNKKLRELLSIIEDDVKKGELLSESWQNIKSIFHSF